ncbi:ATP-binding protein [Yinghuangia sp. ASG 101]|uniref:ATP-binding protein n=1 Tax=Yinghuangia sp. ASG 101 TaxID=2896848 RepID=UPI001E2A944C|nr:ATP-binding protein [Yinghuangia sp. ASG 101]UGQ15219.1 ATP-binding protein [Yinghuangia sp. ASG 101]
MHDLRLGFDADLICRVVLPSVPAAAGLARKYIAPAAQQLGVDYDTAALVATELVSNAVRHADTGGDIELWVSANDSDWFVAVVDRAPHLLPRLPHGTYELPDDKAESGRGLLIVALGGGRLSVRPVADGRKVVSARMALPSWA